MVLETSTLKVIYNSTAWSLSTLLVWLGLNEQTFSIFAVLLIIDYVTGLFKAAAIKESITSNKMKYGVISKLSLIMVPVVLALAGKAMSFDVTYLVFWAMNLLVLSEVYSIIGNIYTIRSKKELPEYDVLVILGKKISQAMIHGIGGQK